MQCTQRHCLPLQAAVAFNSSCVAFKTVALGSSLKREASARAATGQSKSLCWRHLRPDEIAWLGVRLQKMGDAKMHDVI
jgi:hypothetical protein